MKNNIFKIISLILLFTVPNFLIYRCIRNNCDWSDFKGETFHGIISKKYQDFKHSGNLRIETREKIIFMFRAGVNKEENIYNTLSLGDSVYKKENETLLYIQKRDKLEIINFDTIYEPCGN